MSNEERDWLDTVLSLSTIAGAAAGMWLNRRNRSYADASGLDWCLLAVCSAGMMVSLAHVARRVDRRSQFQHKLERLTMFEPLRSSCSTN